MEFPSPDDLIKPWDWNFILDLVVWFIVFMLVLGIWLWTRSGWLRRHLPDLLGRNIEDFAGVVQESNGRVPLFLLIFYLTVTFAMIAYPIVTLIFNYDY